MNFAVKNKSTNLSVSVLCKLADLLLCIFMFVGWAPVIIRVNATTTSETIRYNHKNCKYDSGSTYCLVCDLAQKINDLPLPENISIYNAATVTSQIHAIDRIKFDLEDEEYYEMIELLDGGIDRYFNAVTAIDKITGGTQLVVKKFLVVKRMILWI